MKSKRKNPIPTNYQPRIDYSDYSPEPLDLVGDAALSIMDAARYVVKNNPMYVGKHLMDAAYLFNAYLEEVGNDPVILRTITRLRELAKAENYTDRQWVEEEFLSIVEPLEFWAEDRPYAVRVGTTKVLDKIIRILQGRLSKTDKLVDEMTQKLTEGIKRRPPQLRRKNPLDTKGSPQPGCYCYQCELRRKRMGQGWTFPTISGRDGTARAGTFNTDEFEKDPAKKWIRRSTREWRRRNPRKQVICGTQVKVQRYGGGTRYYCPRCDLRRDYYGMTWISWANASPPADYRCQKIAMDKPKRRAPHWRWRLR